MLLFYGNTTRDTKRMMIIYFAGREYEMQLLWMICNNFDWDLQHIFLAIKTLDHFHALIKINWILTSNQQYFNQQYFFRMKKTVRRTLIPWSKLPFSQTIRFPIGSRVNFDSMKNPVRHKCYSHFWKNASSWEINTRWQTFGRTHCNASNIDSARCDKTTASRIECDLIK